MNIRRIGHQSAFLLFIVSASLAHAQSRPELVLDRILFAKSDLEISGFAFLDSQKFVFVSDNERDHYLYGVDERKKRFHTPKVVNLREFEGFDAYEKAMEGDQRLHEKDRRLDLEGAARCGTDVYLINERLRDVLRFDLSKKAFNRVPLDLMAYPRMLEGGANAGLEGIAIDCEKQIMYLAKEREPRFILTVDMKTWRIIFEKDLPPANRAGQRVIDFITGDGLMTLTTDFSDLFFRGGFLYVVERSEYQVAKVDPATMTVVARVSYWKTEKDLYTTGEPFGLAEALFITDEYVIVGFDNNKNPLSIFTMQKYGVSGNVGAIAYFKRPKDF